MDLKASASHPLVDLTESGSEFLLKGGDPKGRDGVHTVVSKWPGWRRCRLTSAYHSTYLGPLSALSAVCLTETSLALRLSPAAQEQIESLLMRVHMVEEALANRTKLTNPSPGRHPMHHQWNALHALEHMEYRAILADDMGLGKTSTALWAWAASAAERLLVVCPASVKFNWDEEIKVTLGEEMWKQTMVIHGSREHRANQFTRLPAVKVAIINYDLLSYLAPEQRTRLQVWSDGGFLVLDESHYVKDRNAARSRHCRNLKPKQVLLLSGTPVRNTVVDLYNQVEAVAPKTWNSFRDFQRRYCVFRPLVINQGRRTIQQFAGVQNEKELNAIMHTVQIRRKKEEVLNLPEKTHTIPKLTLDDASRRIYRAMKDWGLMQLDELDPDMNIFNPRAGSAIEVFMRLEQIAQGCLGGIPDPVMGQISSIIAKNGAKIEHRKNEIMLPKSVKIIWLLETIKTLIQTDHRPVIFCRFNAPLFWLHQNLEWDSLALHGGVKDKHQVIRDFQDGKAPILLCQVKMAEGFNLTRSQDCIFLGRDWSPAQNRQAEDRLHRIGQTGTVNIQIPVVRGTIDMVLHDRLQVKEDSARVVLAKLTVGELKELLR